MSESNSFDQLLDGLAVNNQDAAEVVFRRYYGRIIGVIRRRIGQKYQAKVDAESVANSALKSFYRRYTGDRLSMTDWQDLWNLITQIAVNKLKNRIRKFKSKGRDIECEEDHDAKDVGVPWLNNPELEAIASDLYDRLICDTTLKERTVLDLTLQGYQVIEMATVIGVSDRMVKRIRKKFHRKLLELLYN